MKMKGKNQQTDNAGTADSDLASVLKRNFKGGILFTKYPELVNKKDLGKTGSKFPFVEGGYNDQIIVAETMRFYSLAVLAGAQFLMPTQAPPEQIKNLNEKLGLSKTPKLIFYDNDKPQEYTKLVNSLPRGSVHVLHPFDNIHPETYAIDPNLLSHANTKTNLSELTPNTPKRKIISLEQLLKENLQAPFVIKKTTGSSGDGVKIVKKPAEVNALNPFLKGETKFIIEEYIDCKQNYGIQFFIEKDGTIHYVGFNYQKTTDAGEYEGAVCVLDEKPDSKLLQVGLDACKKLASKGYWGFAGFDVLEDAKGTFYVIDPNIRATATTPVHILKDKLATLLGRYVYVYSSKMNADSAQQVIDAVNNEGGLLLSMSHKKNNYYKYFVMFGADTPKEAVGKAYKIKDLSNNKGVV